MMMMRKRVLGFNDLECRCVSDGGGLYTLGDLWPAWCFILLRIAKRIYSFCPQIYAHIYTHNTFTHRHTYISAFEAARELQLFSFGAKKGRGFIFILALGEGRGVAW